MGRSSLGKLCVGVFLLCTTAACGGENLFTEPGTGGEDSEVGTIRGQVTSAGVGVGNVQIILVDRDSTRTDSQGVYEFTDLPTATYDVSIRVPANYTLGIDDETSQRVDVTPGGVVTANWTLTLEDGATGNSLPVRTVIPMP